MGEAGLQPQGSACHLLSPHRTLPPNSIPYREGSTAHTCGYRSRQLKLTLPTHTPGPPLGAQRAVSQSSLGGGKNPGAKMLASSVNNF